MIEKIAQDICEKSITKTIYPAADKPVSIPSLVESCTFFMKISTK